MRRLIFSLLVGLVPYVQAEVVGGHELSDAEGLVQDMTLKLNRGVCNVLTGWGEIPRQMILAGSDRGWLAVLPVGIPAGAVMTVVRTATGAFEAATFFIPVDDSYGPLIRPAFVWQRRPGAVRSKKQISACAEAATAETCKAAPAAPAEAAVCPESAWQRQDEGAESAAASDGMQ